MLLIFVMMFSVNPQDSLDLFVQRGMEAFYRENYDSSKFYINKVIQADTNNPFGYFIYTGLLRLYASDFVTDSLIDSFYYYANKTIKKALLRLGKDNKKEDAWAHFFIGGVNMYIASLCIERGDYIKSLGYAEKSIGEINTCLRIDPRLYDAYLALGSYEYLKGSFPLWGRYKEDGIEKIRIAAERSKYSGPIARNILAILLLREKRFDEAIQEAKKLIISYPESRTFRWTLCKSYMGKDDWNNAIKCYNELLLKIKKEQPHNIYNRVQIELSLAKSYYSVGDYKSAQMYCEDIFLIGKKDKRTIGMQKEAMVIYKKLAKINK